MRLITFFMISLFLALCACSHMKSVYNAPSKQNTCINLERQMMFSNTASGNKTQWSVQSEKMQLEYAYRQAHCYQIMQEHDTANQPKNTTSSKKNKS